MKLPELTCVYKGQCNHIHVAMTEGVIILSDLIPWVLKQRSESISRDDSCTGAWWALGTSWATWLSLLTLAGLPELLKRQTLCKLSFSVKCMFFTIVPPGVVGSDCMQECIQRPGTHTEDWEGFRNGLSGLSLEGVIGVKGVICKTPDCVPEWAEVVV